jgi:thiol:disulfide interchange protein DsbC
MRTLLAASLLANALAASADEAAVRRMLQEKMRGSAVIESVRKAPFAGMYEVVVRSPDGPQIYYVDEKASVILIGQAFEARSGRNLTKERERQLTAIQWGSLPFADAVTMVRGTGRRKIAIFSDPNCPYCKRLEQDLAKLDDITVHIFLYPVIRPESVPLVKAVWCSKDRARAWNDLMLRDIAPAAKPDCDTPVEKLVALGNRLRANSTPTWFLENGERHSGAMPLEEIRTLLDQASPEKR